MDWNKYYENMKCESFEDPVICMHLPKELFYESYKDLLDTMDGKDPTSCMDFYYEMNPVNEGMYMFKDDDAREDFILICQEYNLILDYNEVCEGESLAEKDARLAQLRFAQDKQRIKLGQKKALSKDKVEIIKRAQLEKSMKEITDKLRTIPTDDPKTVKLSKKLDTIVQMLENSI